MVQRSGEFETAFRVDPAACGYNSAKQHVRAHSHETHFRPRPRVKRNKRNSRDHFSRPERNCCPNRIPSALCQLYEQGEGNVFRSRNLPSFSLLPPLTARRSRMLFSSLRPTPHVMRRSPLFDARLRAFFQFLANGFDSEPAANTFFVDIGFWAAPFSDSTRNQRRRQCACPFQLRLAIFFLELFDVKKKHPSARGPREFPILGIGGGNFSVGMQKLKPKSQRIAKGVKEKGERFFLSWCATRPRGNLFGFGRWQRARGLETELVPIAFFHKIRERSLAQRFLDRFRVQFLSQIDLAGVRCASQILCFGLFV